jgi:FkbH-like protein
MNFPSPSSSTAAAIEHALTRAQWQRPLFATTSRADLAGLRPGWPCRTLRVAVLRNHGFEAVASATTPYAAWNGLACHWRIGDYDDSLAGLDAIADADAVVVWLDLDRLARLDAPARIDWLSERLQALRGRTGVPILVLAWPLAADDLARLASSAAPGVHVIDLAPLAAELGDRWLEPRTAPLSGTRIGGRGCLHVARSLACCWLPAAVLPPRKAVVLDLDETLYQGVVGEDGAAGVRLTPGHRRLHEHLAALRMQGVLLALVSRNEREDVEQLFATRRDFPLKRDAFCAIEASWDDKAGLVERIAARLRVDSSALVVVDDNAGELADVAAHTRAFTVHAQADGDETLAALRHVSGLLRWHSVAEDALRERDLKAAPAREALARAAASHEAYLRNLEVRLRFAAARQEDVPRIHDLVHKTNQFNLSLRRTGVADIARRVAEPRAVITVSLADRLADSGIVAALIGRHEDDRLEIEEVCVSCRALGRRIEGPMLAHAIRLMAAPAQPRRVRFHVQAGPRNAPALEWLRSHAKDAGRTPHCDVPYKRLHAVPMPSAIAIEELPA